MDAAGNQLTVTNASGTVTRVYDEQSRVISKTVSGAGTSTYLYDVTTGVPANCTGEVTTDAKGNIATRVYDRAGRLYQIISGSDVTTYTYMDNGSLELLTYPNGLTAEYTYYDNNKLHTLANKSGNTILSAYNYAYDGCGNLVTELDIDGTTTYTYDELNRLESVTEPDGKLTEYTYDAAGNRETETVTDGSDVTTTNYPYDEDLNRLSGTLKTLPSGAYEATLYIYDMNGALVSKHTETLEDTEAGDEPALGLSLTGDGGDGYALYAYDVWGQLTSAETPDSVSAYAYNGEGLRVSKSVTENEETTETAYLYEYSKVVLELDENGDEAAHNVYGNNTLISRTTGDGTLYYLYNGHGDVVQLADALGAIVMTYDYDAFGVVTTATGSISNSYLYSGYQYDGETGMYYLNARYYDPVVARFVSADTYLGQVNDPLSLNVYSYCRNNPLIYWDSTGHYVSLTDQANLTASQIKQLEQATKDWEAAPAGSAGDAQRSAANAAANAIRASAGYSGGGNGNSISVSKGKTTKTVVINDTTTVNNSGTIVTVNVLTGAVSAISNSGAIETVNNSGTITTINNSGKISTINNSGTVGSIKNSYSGSIGTVNNNGTLGAIDSSGSVGTIRNSGTVGMVKNSGIITNVDNISGGIVGTISNARTISNISTGESTSTNITNTGAISSMVIGAGSTVNVINSGIINSVYDGDAGLWYYNKETNAIKDFQSKYTTGVYKDYEYVTYTFANDIFGDGDLYYGYVTPITIKRDNVCIPPVWDNSRVISYLHTHPNRGYSLVPSGMDKVVAEVTERPFYVVTNKGYKAYTPQYGGDVGKIFENIGPEVVGDASDWIDYYQGNASDWINNHWNDIWK